MSEEKRFEVRLYTEEIVSQQTVDDCCEKMAESAESLKECIIVAKDPTITTPDAVKVSEQIKIIHEYLEDIYEHSKGHTEVYQAMVTGEIAEITKSAGLYTCLWHPEKENITHAHQLIQPFRKGLTVLQKVSSEPEQRSAHHEITVEFVSIYLSYCEKYPDAIVKVRLSPTSPGELKCYTQKMS